MARASSIALLAALLAVGCTFGPAGGPDEQAAIDHYVAAKMLADAGKTDQALAELDRAIKAKADLAAAHALIGRIHCSRQQWELAAAAYVEAVRANPFDMDLREALAACYERLGQTHKAERTRRGGDVAEAGP